MQIRSSSGRKALRSLSSSAMPTWRGSSQGETGIMMTIMMTITVTRTEIAECRAGLVGALGSCFQPAARLVAVLPAHFIERMPILATDDLVVVVLLGSRYSERR